MSKNTILISQLLIAVVLASGCSPQPTVPVAQLGDSVRSVMGNQIHDPEAAINPDPNAVEGGDPYRLDAVLDAFRSDVSKPQDVQQPIVINTQR